VATKLKDLKLDDAHATAVLEKAIEYESYTEAMPTSRRERIKAATEQVALMIDAWVDDEVTPDNEDEDVAEMGQIIQGIFEIAGVEVDDEGKVNYVEPADLDEESDDDEDAEDDNETDEESDEESEGGDDEAAIDINDIIDGYDDLSASSKVKAIKKLELDMEDDDDYNTAVALYEYEEAQEKPSSRVLTWLDDLIPKDEDGGEESEEEDEDAEDAEEEDAEEFEEEEEDGEEEAEEEGDWEEPWPKYDKQTATDVKKTLDKMLADDELSVEMAQYVIDYETAREKPPTRKRIIDYATKLLTQLEGEGEEEPEEEEEPQEEAPKRRSGRPARAKRARSRRGSSSADPDDNEDADDAVARDDEKESRRGSKSGGKITLTREQILEALEQGEIEIEV
jgi:hypothetical protein